MERNFAKALAVTLRYEGGYVNHPSDPGGETNYGITWRTYNAYRKRKGLAPRSVRQIEEHEVAAIYREQYWDLVRGDELPTGLDLCLFDFAVNSGPTRAVREAQKVLGLRTDGDMGQITLEAIKQRERMGLIREYQTARLRFCQSLRTWGTFGRGWAARIGGVERIARQWATGSQISPPSIAKGADKRADPRDLKVTKTQTGQGAVVTGAGTAGTIITDAADRIAPLGEWSEVFKVVFGILIVVGVGLTLYGVLKSIKREGTA